jgi:hypothetical protein
VSGRPQSATNQTAIYTGTDAPRLVGAHVLGFPNAALRAILAEASIVRRAPPGTSASFANAYPGEYLAALRLRHLPSEGPEPVFPEKLRRRLRASASTLAMSAGDVAFRTFDDARAGRALTSDLDGSVARRRGLSLPTWTAPEAAEIFWSIAADFTLFEHFLADEAGHEQSFEAAQQALTAFDAFAREVIARRPQETCVLVCSDHGNVEDLRSRNHTLNPVPFLSFGLERSPVPLVTVADVGRLCAKLLEG